MFCTFTTHYLSGVTLQSNVTQYLQFYDRYEYEKSMQSSNNKIIKNKQKKDIPLIIACDVFSSTSFFTPILIFPSTSLSTSDNLLINVFDNCWIFIEFLVVESDNFDSISLIFDFDLASNSSNLAEVSYNLNPSNSHNY